jgi:putative membrane protein
MMKSRYSQWESEDIWKGVVAGMAAGFVGALAMNGFQKAWSKVTEASQHEREGENPQRSGGSGEQPKSDDATMKAANRIAKAVLNRELSHEEKEKAGPIVHYSLPLTTVGQGTAFSSALWLFGDEIAVPALGLSGSPLKAPISSHAYAWASHLVYGFTTEWARRGTRIMLADRHSRLSEIPKAATSRNRHRQERAA